MFFRQRFSVDNELRDRPDRHGKILSVQWFVYQPSGLCDKATANAQPRQRKRIFQRRLEHRNFLPGAGEELDHGSGNRRTRFAKMLP